MRHHIQIRAKLLLSSIYTNMLIVSSRKFVQKVNADTLMALQVLMEYMLVGIKGIFSQLLSMLKFEKKSYKSEGAP